jgi:hypothetical protein
MCQSIYRGNQWKKLSRQTARSSMNSPAAGGAWHIKPNRHIQKGKKNANQTIPEKIQKTIFCGLIAGLALLQGVQNVLDATTHFSVLL